MRTSKTDPRLEEYLSSLEKVLRAMPVSDRADIVTEIKSHILTALERDPEQNLDQVLAALGPAETVANRYLLERGLKPSKPPIAPMVKWLVIGFMGCVAMGLAFAALLVFRFSPILHVNEADEYVSILGGLIEIDGRKGTFKVGPTSGEWDETSSEDPLENFNGSRPVGEAKAQKIRVKFGNGKVELRNSTDRDFGWDCEARTGSDEPRPAEEDGVMLFDLGDLPGVKCQFSIPQAVAVVLEGSNGKVAVAEPRYDLDVSMGNGRVTLAPESGRSYKYSLSVKRGKVDSFQSSEDPKAHQISVKLSTGCLTK